MSMQFYQYMDSKPRIFVKFTKCGNMTLKDHNNIKNNNTNNNSINKNKHTERGSAKTSMSSCAKSHALLGVVKCDQEECIYLC